MRQTLAFSVLTIMTIYPETTILILVLTMLALHIASKLISNNIFQNQYNLKENQNAYQLTKNLLNNQNSKIYIQDKKRSKTSTLQGEKQIRQYISGLPTNLENEDYRDIQQICRQLNITNLNRKKTLLVQDIKALTQ